MTGQTPTPDLDALRRLLVEATPRPWLVYEEDVADENAAAEELAAQARNTPGWVPRLSCLTAQVGDAWRAPAITGCGPTSSANAALIAALVNAADALLTACEAGEVAEAELAEWRKHHCEKRITTRCPSCGHQSLFIAVGGHLTCSWLKCPEPSVEAQLAAERTAREAVERRCADISQAYALMEADWEGHDDGQCACRWGVGTAYAQQLEECAMHHDRRVAAEAKLAEVEALAERLKLEAQGHAQEARTANATIAECYQVATGSTGEPGNWHGAEPIRALKAKLAAAEAREAGLRKARADIAAMPTREEWIGGQRAQYIQAAEVLYIIDSALKEQP